MEVENEVSDLSIMDSRHNSSSSQGAVTHIKEEDLSDREDAGEDGGWIAMEDTDSGDIYEENNLQVEVLQRNRDGGNFTSLNAKTVQTSKTTRRKGVASESTNCLTEDRDPPTNRTKGAPSLDKQVVRARKSLKTTKTAHPSRIRPTNDVHSEKAKNGDSSVYYCDDCSRFFTTEKLYVKHARRHARDNESKHSCLRAGLEKGHLKEKRVDDKVRRRDQKITNEEHEEGRVRGDASEIRKRLGLRIARSVPARFRNGAENHADSSSEDGKNSRRRRKQLAPRENKQSVIKAESSDDDSSSEVDVKRREAKALIRRIRRRCPPKLKNKSPNICPQCGHCFKKKTDLQRHLRVHSGEKPYACGLCDMRFTRNFGLQCHMRTHAGLKIHACATCGKSYSRRYDLVKHERAVHTGERNHVCGDCDKRFVTAQLLRVHERTHTNSQPYLCQECGHRSNHRSDLKKHMRTHTNERPYCCPICKKSFLQSGSLTSHMAHAHGK